MQYLQIEQDTTLRSLSKLLGSRNVDIVLNANQLERTPEIGKQLSEKVSASYKNDPVPWQRKFTLLNQCVDDSDIYEYAACMSESSWKAYEQYNTFPGMLYIPDRVQLPDNVATLGNHQHVETEIFNKVNEYLVDKEGIYGHRINPEVFSTYSSDSYGSTKIEVLNAVNPIQWFRLPWGKISLYSDIDGEMLDFPVYPEELSDNRNANYEQMPEMIYQYEPWQVYKSSGPRTMVYKFDMHRDMWSGDHRDGKCEDLIDFCFANCYPEFNGAAVNVPLCTMYINGKSNCRGVITDVSPTWDGPIGIDGWYLHCVLEIQMTEVSDIPLNYHSVRNRNAVKTI